jgi:hypothetical protein
MLFKGTPSNLLCFVYRTIKQVDTNTRFLYDQVLNSSLWFKRRGRFRAYRRDKSTTNNSDEKGKDYVPLCVASHSLNRSLMANLGDGWATFFRLNTRNQELLRAISSLRGSESSLLFRGKSRNSSAVE